MSPFESFSRKLAEQTSARRIASTCKECGLVILGSVANGLQSYEAEHLLGFHSHVFSPDQKNGFILYESIRRALKNTVIQDQTFEYLLQLEAAVKQQVEAKGGTSFSAVRGSIRYSLPFPGGEGTAVADGERS